MVESARNEPDPLALALGRVPSGLYILTARHNGQATGMLASWVQQAGFDPPLLTLALHRERYLGDWIVASGRFALSQIAAGQKRLLRHFARGFPPGEPAFEGLEPLDEVAQGGPVLAEALAYLDAELVHTIETGGDHRLLLARVVAGALLDEDRDAKPMLHVRHNGLHY
ncbi:hypothetical protein BH23PLA1_BH23PLA1_11940 [soil metagenome]